MYIIILHQQNIILDILVFSQDFESEPVQISYTKNGTDLGKAFEIEVSTLKEGALFPHILTKNCEFECNFGEKVRMCSST